ncbi:MAG: hypothetical protein J7K40_01680 [candidate division Zixibacteria bacterium]|nr:hypothetical protein [candidate division Zixibacteria bacterium]
MPEVRTKIPKRIGIVLSSEFIWETVFNLYQIEKNGYMRMAITVLPDENEKQLIHFKKHIIGIMAGIDLVNADDVKPGSLRALILSASESEFNSLSNFEEKGEAFDVDHNLRAFIRVVYRRGLPIGAFGYMAPLIVKSVQGITETGPVVTVGNNPKLQSAIITAGGQAITTRPTEVIIDHENKLATSGGQIGSSRLTEVAEDCENMFTAIKELIKG